jgi:hypothetical protein
MKMARSEITGEKTLTGTWGEVWLNGEKIFELSKIELKVSANREDVQVGMDVDSKLVGLKGEGTITIRKVYSRYKDIIESYTKGKDIRANILAKLKDPDAIGGQEERWYIDNVWYNELPIVSWEKGGIIEEEIGIGFSPSRLQPQSSIV